nr:MAG TPA: hypothetical protein [Caudoviricetes sp.]
MAFLFPNRTRELARTFDILIFRSSYKSNQIV